MALLSGAAAALPLFLNSGFLNTRAGGDSPFLLFRLHQLYAAMSQGVFPVRWMPDAAYGLGFPFFNYYSALPYYFAAGLKAFGFGYVLSLKLTQLAGFLVAAWAMYGWVRASGGNQTGSGNHIGSGDHIGSPLRALLASAAYTFAPFHLANVYVRGDSLSEFWAFAFYPLILWAALRLRQKPDFNRALALGLAYAALILTHNISALIFTPFLLIYIVVLALGHGSKIQDTRMQDTGNAIRSTESGTPASDAGAGVWNMFHTSRFTLHASFSLLLALALSAFYWLPALGESGYIQLGAQTTGFFFYGNHFRRLSADLHAVDSFVQPGFFFDYDITLAGTSPFSMGLVQTVLLAAALVAITIKQVRPDFPTGQRGDGSTWRRGDGVTGRPVTRSPLLITGTGIGFLLLGLALSTFMVLPISAPLWANLPLLPLVQFPWRFLSVQSLFVSALMAYGVPRHLRPGQVSQIADRISRVTLRAAVLFIGHLSFVIVLALAALGGLRPDFVRITDGDVTPERLQLYEYFTGNIGTTIRAEYLPEAVIPRPYTSDEFLDRRPRVKVLAGEAEGQRLEKRAASQTWHIAVASPGGSATVAVPLHYFPGWKATAGGQPLPITAAPGLGYIQFELPPGDHVVELKLGRTPLRAAAETLSLLALLGSFGIAATLRIGRSHLRISPEIEHETPFHVQFRRAFLPGTFAAALALLLASALSALLPESGEKGQSLTADFNQQAYHSSAPVRYDTGAFLEAYDYDKDHIRPGETLSIRINSQDPRETGPVQGSLRLVTPAAIYLNATSDAGSLRQAFHLSPDALAQIKLPADLPSGVYLPELTVEGAESLTSSGRPRGALYLAPVFVDRPGPAATAPLATFGPAIGLLNATSRELAPGLLKLSLIWQAAADVPQNYALALRLHDVVGNEWYALDTQPAYGFYPTGMWLPGEVIPDSFEIRLPDGLPPSAGYTLGITLYDAGTLQPIGSFDLPVVLSLATPLSGRQTRFQPIPEIGLEGVDLPARVLQGAALVLDARWLVLQIPAANYIARWTLSGPAVYVADADLAPGSPPTTWQANSFILGRAAIPIPPDLPPGMYTLTLQLLSGPDRPAGNIVEVGAVEVTGRERVFAAPPVSVEMGTTFGDQIKLWGYDLSREANTLALTVQWSALARPEKDYNFFLHLVGAEDIPAAQLDSMPRNYTYPTSLWLPGEVVSDTLTLDLHGVPPGDYRLALGWYDPTSATLERLAAFDAEGKPLEGERVVLEEVVKVR